MGNYQWPASRLSEKEMAILFQMRCKTSKSICELLREAVHVAYSEVKDETIARRISQDSSKTV